MSIKVLAAAAIVLASMAGSANAKGCLKGAAVGGVAGHVAGHHGLLGAAAGCAIGHHRASKATREDPASGSKSRATPPANGPAGSATDKHAI